MMAPWRIGTLKYNEIKIEEWPSWAKWDQSGPNGAKLGQIAPNLWPTWGQVKPSWSQVEAKLGQIQPSQAKLGQVGTKLRPSQAKLGQVGQVEAKLGQVGAKFRSQSGLQFELRLDI